jgi:hypothetical protein
MVWRQIVISMRSTWLPGDERGWRSRRHKRHSSGDYKNPPPKNEHEGLRKYVKNRAMDPVEIKWGNRDRVGLEILEQFQKRGYRVLCVSVSKKHIHLLVELPIDLTETKRIVGLCKGAASHALRDIMPGCIFAEGAKYDPIVDLEHHQNVYDYILYKQGRGAFSWSFKDTNPTFVPGRKRPAWTKTRARRV